VKFFATLFFIVASLRGASDPSYSFVSSLIQFSGTNGQTTGNDDKTGTTLTFNNGAALSTTSPPTGMPSSLATDGTNDFVNFTDAGQWDLGSGDFTIEWWFKNTAIAANQAFLGNYLGSDTHKGYIIDMSTTNLRVVRDNDTVNQVALTLTSGSWYAGCLCKTGTSAQFYINGATQGASFSDSKTYTPDTNVSPSIGRASAADGEYWNGNIGPIRITKGLCRYSGAYTVPSLPLPTSGEDVLSPYLKNSNRLNLTPPRLFMWLFDAFTTKGYAMSSDNRLESQRNQALMKTELDLYTRNKYISDVTAKRIVTPTPTPTPAPRATTPTKTPTPGK
jgi:hypothetical protein